MFRSLLAPIAALLLALLFTQPAIAGNTSALIPNAVTPSSRRILRNPYPSPMCSRLETAYPSPCLDSLIPGILVTCRPHP